HASRAPLFPYSTLFRSLIPALFVLVAASGGVTVLSGPVFAMAVVLASSGFFVPRLLVRNEASRRRDDFRHGLSAYLDLVAILLRSEERRVGKECRSGGR